MIEQNRKLDFNTRKVAGNTNMNSDSEVETKKKLNADPFWAKTTTYI